MKSTLTVATWWCGPFAAVVDEGEDSLHRLVHRDVVDGSAEDDGDTSHGVRPHRFAMCAPMWRPTDPWLGRELRSHSASFQDDETGALASERYTAGGVPPYRSPDTT